MELGVVEQYRSTRLARLELKKQYDALEAEEKKLKQKIIDELRAGTPHRGVVLTEKLKPTVADWNALYKHIQATGEFELLQRRVTESAALERWSEGVAIPGVNWFPVFDIKVG